MNRSAIVLAAALCASVLTGSVEAADVKDPAYGERLGAFKKALQRFPEAEKIPLPPKGENFLSAHQKAQRAGVAEADIVARLASVHGFADTRDSRVFEELVKALPGLYRAIGTSSAALEEATEKFEAARIPHFESREEYFRRTGNWPDTILVSVGKSLDALEWPQLEAAIALDRVLRLRDAVIRGMGTNLVLLGEERTTVWKAARKLGLESRDPEDRIAFCLAARSVPGAEAEAALLEIEAADADVNVVVAALDALAARRSPAALPRLRERLKSKDSTLALAAVRGLARYRGAEVVELLIARMEGAEGRVLEDLVDTLFAITGKHVPDTHGAWDGWWKGNREKFLLRWAEDPEERILEIENIGLTDGRLIDVPAELAALLPTEAHPGCREAILENLSIHRSDFARRTLLDVLDDPDPATRMAAIRGLSRYRHLTVPEELMRRVEVVEGEELKAIFQTLRTLWGADEFSCKEAAREPLLQWWDSVKSRVVEQFTKLGERGVGSGRTPPADLSGEWKDRNFYGLKLLSQRVLFVVDISLSMEEPAQKQSSSDAPAKGWRKIDVARNELKRALQALPDGTLFGLVAFAVKEEVLDQGLMEMTSATRKKALEWVEALKTREATNVYDALEAAFAVGTPRSPLRSAGVPDTIYFVSDGAPTVGKFLKPDVIREHVRRWNATRGVKIHVIGVGEDHDILFCRSLAEENGGFYVAR